MRRESTGLRRRWSRIVGGMGVHPNSRIPNKSELEANRRYHFYRLIRRKFSCFQGANFPAVEVVEVVAQHALAIATLSFSVESAFPAC